MEMQAVDARAWGAPVIVERTQGVAITVVILALSIAYTLALFPGVEWHPSYSGNAYKALHPESFPKDEYLSATSTKALSSYYLLVRLAGEIWLDDRFGILVFLILVVVTLIGVDKTARVLGADRVEERLAVLALMALPHGFRGVTGMIVTHADFYAGTFASVLTIWLIYSVLADAPLWRLVIAIVLLWSLNAKWALFPTLIAMAIVYRERLSQKAQRWGMALLALGVVGGYLGYYYGLRPSGQEHVLLFDFLNRLEDTENNPLREGWIGNLLYFLLLGVGIFVTPGSKVQQARVRTIAVIGALIWIGAVLYFSYAPDVLKIPYVVPLSFNHGTMWPQYILYVSICVGALTRLRDPSLPTTRRILWLGVLVVWYGSFVPLRVGVFGLLAGVGFLLYAFAKGRIERRPGEWRQSLGPRELVTVLGCAFLVATLVVFGRGIAPRSAHLQYLAQHGVVGDNPSAKWTPVNDYIRSRTPLEAKILPVTRRDDNRWQRGLRVDGTLRTRTGRSTPGGDYYAVLFDYDRLQRIDEERRHITRLLDAWQKRDARGVKEQVEYFMPVDYLVVENEDAPWIEDGLRDYEREVALGTFTIFRRIEQDTGR